MSEVLTEPRVVSPHLTLRLNPAIRLSDEEFFALCQLNRDLRLERTSDGDIIIISPTGAETGARNASITAQVFNWSKRDGTGTAFDSSSGFKLPNGAERSPDAAWVARSRLAQLTSEQKQKFLPLSPDFAIELLSPTDHLDTTRAKMDEYISCGTRLGWLIDPHTRRVHIYRPGKPVEILQDAQEVSAEPELPGFVLKLGGIWEPDI